MIGRGPWPFPPLLSRVYTTVVIDPPWTYETWSDTDQVKAANRQYSVMTLDDIKALPIRRLCQDDALVFTWATAPNLTQAIDCLSAWGVRYSTNLIWRKVTKNGKKRMGLGFWARTMHEQVLIGTIGKPRRIKALPSIFDGVAREHSRKPDEFYSLIERHTPGQRRADVFSRESRAGWECFGDEAGKFDRAEGKNLFAKVSGFGLAISQNSDSNEQPRSPS